MTERSKEPDPKQRGPSAGPLPSRPATPSGGGSRYAASRGHTSSSRGHAERHRTDRIGWLRAAVMGANDGIVSTASLLVGIASAGGEGRALVLAGVAGLVAGAMSMAAGEYVSVSSQADTESADLDREREELRLQPEHELRELAGIYESRGLTPELAAQVSAQLTAHDALGAHARDELGVTDTMAVRPLQAAFASAVSFTAGAALPLATAVLAPVSQALIAIGLASVIGLVSLGALSAYAGGAPLGRATGRVVLWGVLAMAATAAVGRLFHIG